MQKQRPGVEALFQLGALWAAKRFRGRLRNTGSNESEFYSEFFTNEDEDVFGWDPRARRRVETVAAAIGKYVPKGLRVLDLGCGLGEVLGGLIADYQCCGVDYATSNVMRASRRLDGRALVQQGSAEAIPFDDASMDAVICLEVLEHLRDDRVALLEMLRVLRSGGILVLAVPYTYYWSAYLQLMGHFRHYTRQSLAALLRGVGCEVVEYLPNFPRWHQRFTRQFIQIKAAHIAATRLNLTKTSLREFELWPGAGSAISHLEQRLEPARADDAKLPYADLATSTFVVARRRIVERQ